GGNFMATRGFGPRGWEEWRNLAKEFVGVAERMMNEETNGATADRSASTPQASALSLLSSLSEKDIVKTFLDEQYRQGKLDTAVLKKQDVVFLIDGSASMCQGLTAPIKALLPLVQAFAEHSAEKGGARVSS